jgi:hypothetical protein
MLFWRYMRHCFAVFSWCVCLFLCITGSSAYADQLLVLATVVSPSQTVEWVDSTQPAFRQFSETLKKSSTWTALFPLLDMDDLTHLAVDDPFQLSPQACASIAKRYHVNTLLRGQLKVTEEGFSGEWIMESPELKKHWSLQADNIDKMTALLVTTIQQFTVDKEDFLSQADFQPQAGEREIILLVSGVSKPLDIVDILSEVQNASNVKEIKFIKVEGNVVHFSLTWIGTNDILKKQMSGLKHLRFPLWQFKESKTVWTMNFSE